jgi:1-acyl-sn-glycerol-3-phosphate acyltransferase
MILNPKTVSKTSVQPEQAIAPLDPHFTPWLLSIVYPLGCRIVMPGYFGHIEVAGREHIPTEGPVILAPTHRARWDALLVPYAAGRWVTGRDLRFMVTADEVKGLQGWLIRRLGGFAVNPKQPTISSLRRGVEILQNGEMLVIFPEGGIFRDDQVHPLKPGLGRIAIQAEASKPGLGVKILPITLRYSEALPGWRSDVSIQIGAPLAVSNYMEGSAKQEAKRLTADLETALRRLDAEQRENVLSPVCSYSSSNS